MKFFKFNSVFQTFKVPYFFNKFYGVLFFTIKRKPDGKFYAKTTFWDFLLFLFSFILTFREFLKFFKAPFKTSKSIVIDMMVKLDTFQSVFRTPLTVVFNFYSKQFMWKIVENLNFIDVKVNSSSFYATF
jgi:hypothetical protein